MRKGWGTLSAPVLRSAPAPRMLYGRVGYSGLANSWHIRREHTSLTSKAADWTHELSCSRRSGGLTRLLDGCTCPTTSEVRSGRHKPQSYRHLALSRDNCCLDCQY